MANYERGYYKFTPCESNTTLFVNGVEIKKDKYHPVNKPEHYNQHGIEAIQAIEASMSAEEFKGYLKGNCLKYIWRFSYKGKAVEDLEKAKVYLGWLIERVKNAKLK